MTRLVLILSVILIASACNKEDNTNLILEGKTTDSRNGAGLNGVTVDIEEQILEGGALNAAYQYAGGATSASGGNYRIEFERENSLEYRVGYAKEGYFFQQYSLNPDLFNPGEVVTRNISMIPEATIAVRIQNVNPETEDDEIRFRYLDANFNCECCDNEFTILEGTAIDTTLECQLHGDYMLHFVYEIMRDSDTTIVDSVYCPAFQLTEVNINY
ncbi:MAG: hypothetical protein MK081_02575 [Flavobacteriales bacterium]|nr:hypothetical protein [Flavobacteriales bacterium]